jgi:hypothetical protein
LPHPSRFSSIQNQKIAPFAYATIVGQAIREGGATHEVQYRG